MSQFSYHRPEELDFSDVVRRDFDLITDILIYHCRFQALPGADRLYVSLRSARPQPVFFSEHFGSEMNGHVLAISDPSLLLDSEMDIGCFYGTQEEDAVFGVIRIAERVAASVGLDRSRIVYWGVSGCALGAAMAAVKSGASAVLVNPLVDGSNMGGSRNADVVAKAFGARSADQFHSEFPMRSRLSEAVAAAEALGIHSRMLLVQNLLDKSFYKRQYEPFCRAMNVPLEGGPNSSGRIRSMIYSHPSGHAPEPAELRPAIISAGVSWLLGPHAAQRDTREIFEVILDKVGRTVFEIPAGISHVQLSSIPARVAADPRTLGAAITAVTVDAQVISMSDPALLDGFHGIESDIRGSWQWTNGNALLSVDRRTDNRRLKIDVIDIAERMPQSQVCSGIADGNVALIVRLRGLGRIMNFQRVVIGLLILLIAGLAGALYLK